MHRILFGAALAILALSVQECHAQEKLKTDGFGSLSGKVTLVGAIPPIVSFEDKMKGSPDKACCLAPKAIGDEKVDRRWVVDKTTKGVANVVVWVMPPKDTYFEIHKDLLKRPDKIIIDQPHCAFLPFVTTYQPYYLNGKNKIPTGQELIVKNSATVNHNVRGISSNKFYPGFNLNMIPQSDLNLTQEFKGKKKEIVPYIMPYALQCDIHTWMAAKLYVFDHPYYAKTNAKGEFEIPDVPAGAEIRLMVHHDEHGWVLRKDGEYKQGRPITIQKDKKTVIELEITP